MCQTGTVKFFNHSRGFGFITPDDGGKDVFVHATALERAGISAINEGDKVSFEIEDDRRGLRRRHRRVVPERFAPHDESLPELIVGRGAEVEPAALETLEGRMVAGAGDAVGADLQIRRVHLPNPLGTLQQRLRRLEVCGGDGDGRYEGQ